MNFGGEELIGDYSGSEIIIVPVPYDETSSWMKGADRGPEAILEASVNLEFYNIESNTGTIKAGIHTLDPVTEKRSPERLVDAVHNLVLSLLSDKKFPVIIGGNHTVTIGSVKAFSERFNNLSVLHLDAHADLRHEYMGSIYNHACVGARIMEFAPVVMVGIRSISGDEEALLDKKRVFYSHELFYDRSLYGKAIDMLDENVYITIDLDVFDPSVIPSTGTPEPGGPGYLELVHFMREVIEKKNVVGFDVVELCPSESNKYADFTAAKIIYQLLSYRYTASKD